MPTSPTPDAASPVHPVVRFVDGVQHGVVGLVDRIDFMSVEETAAALRRLQAAEAGVAAMKLALIAHADRIGVAEAEPSGACVDMVAWLRTQLLLDPREAKRQVTLARRLDDPAHQQTKVALAGGRLDAVAARVILEVVDRLPREVGPELRSEAETHLIGLAGVHDTADLRGLARRIEDVIDPDGADARDAAALSRAEAKAARESWCRLWFDEVEQSATGSFKIDLLSGRKLGRMLESLMSPGRPDPIPLRDEDGKTVSADERRGQALVELIDRIPKDKLPRTGGCEPVVVVTMTLQTLTGGLKAAVLDTGERLSPGAARRLAARHGVIPAVLGSKSEVLDLGRRARLATRKQRLAMNVQQGGRCAAEGCDRPITWADAHHLQQWQAGGATDLANMVMPCRHHHRLADHPDYRVRRLGPGRIRITRRT